MERPENGRLIVFEGPDKVGKSKLVGRLISRLRKAGITCENLAFPGKQKGTLGKLVYDLHHDEVPGLVHKDVNPTSLQVLHIAAHIDAIERQILPALSDGTWVVLDRYWWSTRVYGTVKGVPKSSLKAMIALEQLHWGKVKPDVLFSVEREIDNPEYGRVAQDQVVKGYRELANQEKNRSRVVTIQNDSSVEDALNAVWEVVAPIARRLT
ncbi:MAG: hypothetical protein OXO48_05350 [Caldilineaceae bacterium]|nr:hypothetical protein [Caldilineaceae bacterium]